jgi:hypothetical protein
MCMEIQHILAWFQLGVCKIGGWDPRGLHLAKNITY